MVRCALGVLLAGAFGLWAPASATTYVVQPDGMGDFPTIQAAVDAAVGGDEIVLTSGTFRGGGNRNILWRTKEITIRSESGNPETCVIDCEGGPGAPYRGFCVERVGGDGLLDGVTIRHGWAPGYGGGVFLREASPTISHCIFEEIHAEGGGGIDCDADAAPTILGCTFRGNTAPWGGGLCI